MNKFYGHKNDDRLSSMPKKPSQKKTKIRLETRSSPHSSAIICSSSSIHLDSGLIQVDLRIQQTLDFDYSENDRFRRPLAC